MATQNLWAYETPHSFPEPPTAWTALHLACMGGHDRVVRFLVDTAMMDVAQRDAQGKTGFDHARENGHWEIVEWLETHGERHEAQQTLRERWIEVRRKEDHLSRKEAALEEKMAALRLENQSLRDQVRVAENNKMVQAQNFANELNVLRNTIGTQSRMIVTLNQMIAMLDRQNRFRSGYPAAPLPTANPYLFRWS